MSMPKKRTYFLPGIEGNDIHQVAEQVVELTRQYGVHPVKLRALCDCIKETSKRQEDIYRILELLDKCDPKSTIAFALKRRLREIKEQDKL